MHIFVILPFVNWMDPICLPCCSVASHSVSYCLSLCSCVAIDYRTCCCEEMIVPDVDSRRCQEILTRTLLMAHCRHLANNSLATRPSHGGQLDGLVLLEDSGAQPCYGSFFACSVQWLKIWQICLNMNNLLHKNYFHNWVNNTKLAWPWKIFIYNSKSDCISV